MNVHQRVDGDYAKLEKLVAKTRTAKQRDRYRMVLLALRGWETLDIVDALSSNRRTVQKWVYRYRDGGIDALVSVKNKGHPPRLPEERNAEFIARMTAGPRPSDGVCTLRAKDAQHILEVEFAAVYTVKGVYELMHRLNLACLKPRPRHEKSDPVKMLKFKDETAPFLSAT